MEQKYTYKKRDYKKEGIDGLYVIFENGDYISIKGTEIVDVSISVYDKLVWRNRGVKSVAESGFIKLDLAENGKMRYDSYFLYDEKEYKKDRKNYIFNRCINGRIVSVQPFNSHNWEYAILENVCAETDGKYLTFRFLPDPLMGGAASDEHYVFLKNIVKKDVSRIELDFENCEGFAVFGNEIEELKIQFEKELDWEAGELHRKVKSGFIRLKLDEEYNPRWNNLFNKNPTLKDFKKRLYGKKGFDAHDICHLYVSYNCINSGSNRSEECIIVDDIRSGELKTTEQSAEDDCFYDYVGGYAQKFQDSVLIAFGKNAKDILSKYVKNH